MYCGFAGSGSIFLRSWATSVHRCSGCSTAFGSPDGLQDRPVGQHAIVVSGKQGQQLELLGRQPDLGVAFEHAAPVVVDREIAGAKEPGLGILGRDARGGAPRGCAPAVLPDRTAS